MAGLCTHPKQLQEQGKDKSQPQGGVIRVHAKACASETLSLWSHNESSHSGAAATHRKPFLLGIASCPTQKCQANIICWVSTVSDNKNISLISINKNPFSPRCPSWDTWLWSNSSCNLNGLSQMLMSFMMSFVPVEWSWVAETVRPLLHPPGCSLSPFDVTHLADAHPRRLNYRSSNIQHRYGRSIQIWVPCTWGSAPCWDSNLPGYKVNVPNQATTFCHMLMFLPTNIGMDTVHQSRVKLRVCAVLIRFSFSFPYSLQTFTIR